MFSVATTDLDESILPEESPADYVLRLAEAKARASAQYAHSGHIVIAADTAVVDGEEILGKPANMGAAESMLKQLRGHSHKVYTGIAVFRPQDEKLLTDLCVSVVPMRDYSDEEIETYVQSGDPLDKAGAYAIQHPQFQPVENFNGCYAGVMGLPMCHVVRTLNKLNTSPAADVPAKCQSTLRYQCPVFRAVLRGEQVG